MDQNEMADTDPYAYLERNEFTSELYKIEIKNLHRHAGFGQVKKKLGALGLKPHKVKILQDITFVTFKTAADRDVAIETLDGHVWKGSTLQVKIAKGKADPCMLKRQADSTDDGPEAKQNKPDDIPPSERLRDNVTKFWRKPYADQIKAKQLTMSKFLCQLHNKLVKENPMLHTFLQTSTDENGKLVCPMDPFVASPIEKYYRNKCEFTIGEDLNGKGPFVGFRYGKYRGGVNAVGPPYDLEVMPACMETAVRALQGYLDGAGSAESSPLIGRALEAYSVESGEGYWRTATVRVSRGGDVMLIVDIHPQGLSEDDLTTIKSSLRNYFFEGDAKNANVTSLYLSKRKNNSDTFNSSNVTLLHGKEFITEILNGLKFQISFNAFFQVNTLAAEVLYNEIAKLCTLSKNTILLDVCCGTGTIGLSLAQHVDKVVGVDLCGEAIMDACVNAGLNGIENAEFHTGNAIGALPKILADLPGDKEIVAVVDPPRAGLHSSVITSLRRCSQLNRLIYVSCNPTAAFSNFIDFGRLESNKFVGDPFIPVRAVPVDLFPQTPHVELILLMERCRKL